MYLFTYDAKDDNKSLWASIALFKDATTSLTRSVVALKCLFLIHLTGIKQFSATGFNQLSLTLLKFNFKLIQKLALGQMSSVEKSCGQLFVN